MRFQVVGLGSMGKRRVRNLAALGLTDVVGYDPRRDRCDEAEREHGIAATADWSAARERKTDAWIVSTPPDTHMGYALQAAERGIHFFTEAGVVDPQIRDVIESLKRKNLVGAPSCTMRYFAGPAKILSLLREGAVGRPLVFTYQSGQYLPDWHPWEDYRNFYVSQPNTGACREIVPFELSWLMDAFGGVDGVTCVKDKLSDLDADIDDVYQLLLRFDQGVIGHLLVDVIARPAVRVFRLNGTEGTLEWDHARDAVRVFRAGRGEWETIALTSGSVEPGYIHAEMPYVAEMADFVAAIRGDRKFPNDYERDERVLEVLRRAEASASSGLSQ